MHPIFKFLKPVCPVLPLFLLSCSGIERSGSGDGSSLQPLFELVSPDHSGVRFDNHIEESEEYNYLLYEALYYGAGVAVGDLNNDGLQDIYFGGNLEADKIFLNKGDLRFEDITSRTGIRAFEGWSTGINMVDINADGWMDIYVCKFLLNDGRLLKNHLYINNGDLTFTESAAQYGIADGGYSIHSNFFDYNRDGLLDLYVCNQPPSLRKLRGSASINRDIRYTDRLYRNNGNGTFTDVTAEAGIARFAFTLSATVFDVNEDGWPDIYVACDFFEPDLFFLNNRNGTFTNIADISMRHISYFSMGADIADFNNDGLPDIYVADMVAKDNFRNKTNMSGMNPAKFWDIVNSGGHYQYMFNVLQMNNGHGLFSDIAQLSGVSHTDWSWSPLFVDFDQDGWKDLYVTNGYLRDVRNNDYTKNFETLMEKEKREADSMGVPFNPVQLLDYVPSKRLSNYMFRNKGDLTFDIVMDKWGMDHPSFSHGAAYADLDNDGDMDLVVSNMNDNAFLYRNYASDNRLGNYLNFKLTGFKPNVAAIGAKIEINHKGKKQVRFVNPARGYMSVSDYTVHFGVGEIDRIEKITITWPDGKQTELHDVKTNQIVAVNQEESGLQEADKKDESSYLFETLNAISKLDFKHEESDFDDYQVETLLPYRMSCLGPTMAVGDCNGDGNPDVYLGGASEQSGRLYLLERGGTFTPASTQPWESDRKQEDVGSLFFDMDGDRDLDLLVTSGSNEFSENSSLYQDRLYVNDGKGNFTKAPSGSLPEMVSSSGKAAAGDFDGDGLEDLFIAGRQVPLKYGYPGTSYVLKNTGGKFTDVTDAMFPGLRHLGMVTDGKWVDYDGDGDKDLIVVGEWLPVSFFRNEGETFTNVTDLMGMANTTGWWNCVEIEDMDGDGDPDLVIGNLGLNLKHKASEDEPFRCYVKDFDGNGTNDVYLGYYDEDGVCYPVRGRQCSSEQMPFIKKKFVSYEEFAKADIKDVLEGKLENAIALEAKLFETVYAENLGQGRFEIRKLPIPAQISPTHGIAIYDWNLDGHRDIFLAGNFYHREVETTRSDAGIGCLLLGDGKGGFSPVHPRETGIQAILDVRDVKHLNRIGAPYLLIANNDESVQVYRLKKAVGTIQ